MDFFNVKINSFEQETRENWILKIGHKNTEIDEIS